MSQLFRSIACIRVCVGAGRWLGILLGLVVAPASAQTYISMESPENNKSYTAPASVTVVAEALDIVPVGDVTLYQNGAVIARSSGTGQISKTVSNLGPGDYQFRASAVRSDKRTTQTTPVRTIHVVAPGNLPPTVQLRQPTGAPFIGPATVGLSADASDPDGTVVRVEYFVNGQSVGASASSPYAVTWGNVAAGTYSVTAVATDNNGKTGNSSAMSLSIAQSVIHGWIDGPVGRGDGSYVVGGWACSSGWQQPIDVHMYVGGPAGTGTFAGAITANLASEPAVASVCQTSGTAYRFFIPISDAVRASHPDQPIYIHGLSPVGGPNDLLGNSGKFTVPRMPPPLSQSRRYVYDAQQRLCKTIEPETGATVLGYDDAGQVIWSAAGLNLPDATTCDRDVAYSSGRRVDRSYDAQGRLKQLRFPDRNGDQDWQYAADGLPVQVATLNNAGANQVVNRYTYNKRRLLTGESIEQSGWYNWAVGYGYDANGQLASQTYPSGLSVTYAPNALGQATAVRDTAGVTYASGLHYAPNGALQQFVYGNGVLHTLELNARQMPLRVRDANVSAYEYRYDEVGNVTAIYDQQQGDNFNRTMSYDGLNRLTAATSPSFGGGQTYRYTYDGLDNMTSAKLAGVRQHNYWYDANQRLTNVLDDSGATIIGLTYDLQGNLQQKNTQVYAFDYGNRLREVQGQENYRYDAQGLRVNALDGSGTRLNAFYDKAGQLLHEERRGRGVAEYVYLAGSLLATRLDGVVTYQHTDALGSPVATTDGAGQVVDRTQYEPYGAAIGKSVDGIGYTGHVMDAGTGLVYMQQRYYDPVIPRFLSVDPVTADSVSGANFNRYWYASNNPYRFTDPDGRCTGSRITNTDNTCASTGEFTTQAKSAQSVGVRSVSSIFSHSSVSSPDAAAPPVPSQMPGQTTAAARRFLRSSVGGAVGREAVRRNQKIST
ncbi:Ig-like domain-containing protein [Xanthomonas sp. MUS 060]|uniref:RHS repeat domain-containing protein n=1 Tax=Xanthomonas sp. MUS 060 TaxID=1588031 RepID=UPI000AFDE69F|nr:Ig-like domain-containing protein [Xanthomonas sp. MUS 060]